MVLRHLYEVYYCLTTIRLYETVHFGMQYSRFLKKICLLAHCELQDLILYLRDVTQASKALSEQILSANNNILITLSDLPWGSTLQKG